MDVFQPSTSGDDDLDGTEAILSPDIEDLIEDILVDIQDLDVDAPALFSPPATTEELRSIRSSKSHTACLLQRHSLDEFVRRRIFPQRLPSISPPLSWSHSTPTLRRNSSAMYSCSHSRRLSLNSNYSTLSAATTSTVVTRSSTSSDSLIGARLSQLIAIEQVLMDRDVQSTGNLDIDSFQDAVTDIDPDCSFVDIELIFDRIAGSNSETLSIAAFIEYMDSALRQCRSPKTLQSPTRAFHAAFPDLFAHRDGLETRILWGDAQIGSLHKLLSELEEEAESEGVVDFPEFMAALNNMGIEADKATMQRVFDHVLRQQRSVELQDEVEISFLMQLLEHRVKRQSRFLRPRTLIHLALMDLLLDGDR